MKTKENLINYYKIRLQTVRKMWGDQGERGKDYINNAKEQIKLVENGRTW